MNLFKKEHWIPEQCNRDNLDTWLQQGSKDWGQRSSQKAEKILESHEPEALKADIQKDLDAIRQKAVKKLKDIHFTA